MATEIRQILTSSESPIIAAALSREKVFIWDTKSSSLVSALNTIMDFGGERLALSSSGSHLYAGSFREALLHCYDTRDGGIVWERVDLGEVQEVRFNSNTKTVMCGVEGSNCFIINSTDGSTLQQYPKTNWLVEDLSSSTRFLIRRPLCILTETEATITIPNESFAVLAACFGNGVVAFSESRGDVRCHSIFDGKERWRYRPPAGHHVLDLVYFHHYGKFFALEWHYLQAPTRYRLLKIDEYSGYTECIREFSTMRAHAFSQYDMLFYAFDGSALDVRTGEVVKRLPFEEVTKGGK